MSTVQHAAVLLAVAALLAVCLLASSWGGAHDVTTAPALVRHADPVQAVGR